MSALPEPDGEHDDDRDRASPDKDLERPGERPVRRVARRSPIAVTPGEEWRHQKDRPDDEEQDGDDFEEMHALCRGNRAVRHEEGEGGTAVPRECRRRRRLAAAAEPRKG